MAKKISLLVVVLVAVLALSMTLAACGGSETPTTTAGTTTKDPANTTPADTATPPTIGTTNPADSTANPGSNETPNSSTVANTTQPPVTQTPVTYRGENEKWIEEVLFVEGQWVQLHGDISLTAAKGVDGVDYKYMWYFGFKAEGGHFGTTAEDHPTNPSTPGIQLVNEPVALYIRDVNDENADYSRYDISYWTTAQWYQIWCVADGFVPVKGTSYDIYLVFKTPEDTVLNDGTEIYNGSNYPGQYHYIWNLGAPWTYDPPMSESAYLPQDQFDLIVGNGWWLIENEPTQLYADGSIFIKFKSDGNPFNNNSDTYGVAFTLFDSIYVNGEEYEIVEGSYQTEEWYKIRLQIKDFTPKAGEKYEILLTLTSNDSTGTYCKYERYYVLAADLTITEAE